MVLEHCQNHMDYLDPHRSGEASWEASKIIEKLTGNLRKALKLFIESLPYPDDISSIALPIYREKVH
jgi:hypothetical protein